MLSIIICLLAFFSFANSQPRNIQEKKIIKSEEKPNEAVTKKKRDPEIEALIADAQALPPEFAADFLIRIAGSDKITDNAWKLELLETAFQTATKAQHQYKRGGIHGIHTDTRTGSLNRSHQENMEALTLQCRVVKAVLAFDPPKARQFFEQIPALKLPSLTCKDTLVYEVEIYYETLAQIANKAFSPDEIKREDHIYFVATRIAAIESPSQIGGAAKTIASLQLSPHQLSSLVNSFVQILKNINTENRSFIYAWRMSNQFDFSEMFARCDKVGVDKREVMSAVRDYLLRGLNAPYCEDNISPAQLVKLIKTGFAPVRSIENTIDLTYNNKSFPQITPEEIKPTKFEGKAEVFEYWQSPEAKPFLIKMKQLRFGVGEPPNITGKVALTIEQRSEVKWRKQLAEFLQDFRKWRSEAEKSESDYFHQKAMILEGLNELTPPDTSHDSVVREYVNFLSDSAMQRDNPIEWYFHVKRFITYVARPTTKDHEDALEMMTSAGSPSLNVIARMDKLFPATTKK